MATRTRKVWLLASVLLLTMAAPSAVASTAVGVATASQDDCPDREGRLPIEASRRGAGSWWFHVEILQNGVDSDACATAGWSIDFSDTWQSDTGGCLEDGPRKLCLNRTGTTLEGPTYDLYLNQALSDVRWHGSVTLHFI